MNRLERWLEWRCQWHWGPAVHCREPRRWRFWAWVLESYRDARALLGDL